MEHNYNISKFLVIKLCHQIGKTPSFSGTNRGKFDEKNDSIMILRKLFLKGIYCSKKLNKIYKIGVNVESRERAMY